MNYPQHSQIKRLLSTKIWKTRLVFWCGAILVGVAATAFAIASEYAYQGFQSLLEISPYVPLALTPLVLVLAAWLTRRYFPGAQGSGIPQSMAALEIRDHSRRTLLISMRIALGKILITVLALFGGASVGREGPTVHIGASIMFSLGNIARFPFHYMDRGLILAGSAAGIAAAFNTPLAGIVFAIEEMSRSFEQRTSGTILTAVVLAGLIAIFIQGNYTYFGTSMSHLPLDGSYLAIVVCGIVGGLLGAFFSRSLIIGTRRLAPFQNKHPLWLAGICGLGIAIIGLLSGGLTYGTGYEEAKLLVTGSGDINTEYSILKLLATVFSYLSGIPGGIFSPSLATGAGIGDQIALLFPDTPTTTIVLLGMVAYFSGVIQAPITAFVIVMEMTNNHEMLLPLMATAFIAHGVSKLVCPEPVYRALAIPFMKPDKKQDTTTETRGDTST